MTLSDRAAGSTRCRARFALLLLLLAFPLLLPGCATRQETPAAQPENTPATTEQAPVAQPPATPETTQQDTGTPEVQAQPGVAKETPAPQAEKAAKEPRLSASARLLQSADRDPHAVQPEPGFTLNVPDTIGDGEAFLLEFGAQGVRKVTVHWRGGKLALDPASASRNGVCQALLPVPLDEKSKTLPLALSVLWDDGREEKFSTDMTVKKRKYPVQRLKVESKFVTPPASEQERIKRDREVMRAALSPRTPVQHWSLPMLRPVPGEVTSLYGLRRVFNNVPKNPHKGLDLDAAEGDPIQAADTGVVTLAEDLYYGGNTVIIDHGLGVFTTYMHLSAINVARGQRVERGEIIGLIGSTGRVTGPHLHLSLTVLGQSINVATWLDK